MLQSGWIIETVYKDNKTYAMATYVMQVGNNLIFVMFLRPKQNNTLFPVAVSKMLG